MEPSTVRLWQAAVAAVALMFLTGAAVYAWQERAGDPDPSEVDIGFYEDMTTHHLQAVTMAISYLEGGTDPVLRQIAREIVTVQAGEARLMQQALFVDWGQEETSDDAMAWMGMPVPQDRQPGMATDDELAELEEAEGTELDDLFTRLMIDHHAGGVHMAAFAVEHAGLDDVRRLARSMVTTQNSEIAELGLIRDRLGLDDHEPDP